MKPITTLLLSLSMLLLAASSARANLTVHPMRSSVNPTHGTQIRIYSQSTEAQYVQVSLRRIDSPADPGEKEVDVEASEAAIAITPGKFALSGGGNRLVRVIPLHPVEKETAYRVYFEGARGPESISEDTTEGAQANVGVNLVWGALVNVLPSDGTVQPQLDGNTLRNAGTLRLGITSIADCAGTQCTSHDVSRSLYPGSELQLPFAITPGNTVQLRYRLTRDGYREHTQTLIP